MKYKKEKKDFQLNEKAKLLDKDTKIKIKITYVVDHFDELIK